MTTFQRHPALRTLMMMVAVATVAMAVPSAADTRQARDAAGRTRVDHLRRARLCRRLRLGQHDRPRQGAGTDGPGGRVLRVDPKTGATTTYASGCPRRSPRWASAERSTWPSSVTPRVLVTPRRPRVRPARGRRWHLPDRKGRQCDRDRRSRRLVDRAPAGDRLLRAQRRPVRVAGVPWRLAGHRRPPQPCAARLPPRRRPRAGRVRERCPHRPRCPRPHDRHGRGRPHSASPENGVARLTPRSLATEVASGRA